MDFHHLNQLKEGGGETIGLSDTKMPSSDLQNGSLSHFEHERFQFQNFIFFKTIFVVAVVKNWFFLESFAFAIVKLLCNIAMDGIGGFKYNKKNKGLHDH